MIKRSAWQVWRAFWQRMRRGGHMVTQLSGERGRGGAWELFFLRTSTVEGMLEIAFETLGPRLALAGPIRVGDAPMHVERATVLVAPLRRAAMRAAPAEARRINTLADWLEAASARRVYH